MSESHWDKLDVELDHWYRQGLRCHLWWRDDDLIAATPALSRMHALADEFMTDVLVAVIPAQMSDDLGRQTAGMYRFNFCQHGYAHHNHAGAGSSSEFSAARPLQAMTDDLQRGAVLMRQQFGARLLPVLVPPWNDIGDAMVSALPMLGFAGLSRYALRNPQRGNGLVRVDCHLDVADWAVAPRFRDEHEVALLGRLVEELQERRHDAANSAAPLGVLTHHRAMDDKAWQFMHRLLQLTQAHPATEWLSPRQVFEADAGKGGDHQPGKDFAVRRDEIAASLAAGSRIHRVYRQAIAAVSFAAVAALQQKYRPQLGSFDHHGDYKYADIPLWIAHKAARAVALGLDESAPLSILDIGVGAGHFAAVCNSLGHHCVGIDIDNPLYDDLCRLLGVDRRLQAVLPRQPLPSLGERFDLATIMWQSFDVLGYHADGSRDYFTVADWAFLIGDLLQHQLKRGGRLYVELNKKKFADGRQEFDGELLDWCEKAGATVERASGIIIFVNAGGTSR